MVNDACAEILQRFRLGDTRLFPVHLAKFGNDILLNNQTYYILNIREWCNYAVLEACDQDKLESAGRNSDGNRVHRMSEEKDDSYVLSHAALESDLDLWHEAKYAGSVCFSEALHKAMVSARMERGWGFLRCKLV